MPLVRLENVSKIYRTKEIEFPALKGVSFSAAAGAPRLRRARVRGASEAQEASPALGQLGPGALQPLD